MRCSEKSACLQQAYYSENAARHFPPHALERIFSNEEIINNLLLDYNITQTMEIVNDDGTLRSDLKHLKSLGLCVSDSDHIHPIILQSIGHPAALLGVNHENVETVSAWTDGSKLENGASGYALILDGKPALQHAQRLPYETPVFTAELYAAVTALLLHDPNKDFHLYTDNKAFYDALLNPIALAEKRPFLRDWLLAAS